MDRPADPEAPARRIEISGPLDAHDVEALRLELARLARRYSVEVAEVRVQKPASPTGGASA